jgi:phosphatidate cytidylyltransferase
MLKKRIITAVILIAILLLVLFYLPIQLFFLVTLFITLGAAWEWSNLMELKTLSRRLLYVIGVGAILLSMLFVPILFILLATFVWWLLAIALVAAYPKGSQWWGRGVIWRGVMGLFVLVPCWVAINFIRNANDGDGLYALLFLFALIWGADSGAYFVGKKWGRSKLLPGVSPGKSWQGLGGAMFICLLITLIVLFTCRIPAPVWPWALA